MNDDTGLAEALLGLDGLRVLEVTETPHEVVIAVETTADYVGCASCGTRAVAHERKFVGDPGPGVLRSPCPARVAVLRLALEQPPSAASDWGWRPSGRCSRAPPPLRRSPPSTLGRSKPRSPPCACDEVCSSWSPAEDPATRR